MTEQTDWQKKYSRRGYIPVKVVAYILGKSELTIYRYIQQGMLESIQSYPYTTHSITYDSLLKLIERFRVKPKGSG